MLRRVRKVRLGRGAALLRLWSALGVSVALTSPASAQQDGFGGDEDIADSELGPELGVRVGYGSASGRVTRRTRLEERLAGALPIGVDLGYRVHPRWLIGGFAEYALGFPSDTVSETCPDCTYTWLHLSVQVQYRLWLSEQADVWLSLGTGRHWFNAMVNSEQKRTQSLSGPEHVRLQFGASFLPSPGIAIGPFSSASLGTFSDGVERCAEPSLCPYQRRDLDIGPESAHLSFGTGVRLVFLP